MPSFRSIIVALALATGVSAGVNAPTVTMNLEHANFGSGLKIDALKSSFKVESQVSDDMSMGVNLDNSDSPVKSIFGKFRQKFGNGDVNADLSMEMGDNAIAGDVTYTEGDNTLTASVNSGSSNVVDSVKYSRSGKGWSFNPTFNIGDNSMDLEASADYSDDTNLNVKINAAGESSLEVNHKLDGSTSLNVKGAGADMNGMVVEVSRKLDDDNTLKPKFDMGSKRMTLAWIRKLDAGRTMTMNMDPDNSVGIEIEGANDEDWSATVNSPWGNFKEADVSIGRKFNF